MGKSLSQLGDTPLAAGVFTHDRDDRLPKRRLDTVIAKEGGIREQLRRVLVGLVLGSGCIRVEQTQPIVQPSYFGSSRLVLLKRSRFALPGRGKSGSDALWGEWVVGDADSIQEIQAERRTLPLVRLLGKAAGKYPGSFR